MKIINRMFIGLGLVALMSSCDLTTESKSTKTDADVFSDPTLTEYQLFSITEVFGHTNSHRGRYLPWYGYNTDVEMYVSTTVDSKSQVAQYDLRPNNSQLNTGDNPYNELMTGIERANLAITGIRRYGNVDIRPEMAERLGEALVLRALLYTELLKAFGEVPARFEPVGPDNIYLPKADRDVIYRQLLADLEESFGYLDYDVVKTDRVGLAFAKGLYARLAIMASGMSWRPDDGQVGTGNSGSNRLSSAEDLQKSVLYPKALAALKDVIKNGRLSLMSDYEELWKSVNNMDLTGGKEIIYSIPFSNSRGRWNYTFAVRSENATTMSPSSSSRGGQAGPVPTLYWKYGANDLRRDISCVNFSWEDKGNGTKAYPSGIASWYFGKYRFEWMTAVPYTGGNDDGVKPVYMRYSDILLMAAELANSSESGADRDEDYAKEQLLKVRKRAYRGNEDEAEAYVSALSGETAVFKAIKDERALEFVGEFLRKADLIRWGELGSTVVAAQDEMKSFVAGVGSLGINKVLWYRQTADGIETYGLRPGETESDLVTPPAGSGWILYTDSKGEASNYISDNSFEKKFLYVSGLDKDGIDKRMWWPIFESTVTNSQGALVNDYDY